jgi:hypothetical protein
MDGDEKARMDKYKDITTDSNMTPAVHVTSLLVLDLENLKCLACFLLHGVCISNTFLPTTTTTGIKIASSKTL